jgi:hypothetical protein
VATIVEQGIRIASNFSLLSDSGEITEILTMYEETVSAKSGWTETFQPPADVYVGDEPISVGMRINSTTHVDGGGWFDMLGVNDTWSYDNDTIIELLVAAEDVSVTVPAGTFSCYKVLVTTYYDDGSSDYDWYYFSELVGNYVKVEGTLSFGGMTDHLLLKSYSYSPDLEPPSANAGSDVEIPIGGSATLNASGSSDDKGIVNYSWTFEYDGAKTLYGMTMSCQFDRVGTYNITLTVRDMRGDADTDYVLITVVDNLAPAAEAGSPTYAVEGDTVRLNGSLSSDNTGVVNYTWTFMDGTERTLYGPVVEYTFDTAGIFHVTLTVSDEAGNKGSDSVIVTVNSTSSSESQTTNNDLMTGMVVVIVAAGLAAAVALIVRRRRPPAPVSMTESPSQPTPAPPGPGQP